MKEIANLYCHRTYKYKVHARYIVVEGITIIPYTGSKEAKWEKKQ